MSGQSSKSTAAFYPMTFAHWKLYAVHFENLPLKDDGPLQRLQPFRSDALDEYEKDSTKYQNKSVFKPKLPFFPEFN